MTKWTHIFLEAYCMYDSSKDKVVRTISLDKVKELGGKKAKDSDYKEYPNLLYKKGAKRPVWCVKKFGKRERTPCSECLCDGSGELGKCPFFAFTSVEKDDEQAFDLMWAIKTELVPDCDDKKSFKKFLKRFEAVLKETRKRK